MYVKVGTYSDNKEKREELLDCCDGLQSCHMNMSCDPGGGR